MSATSCRAAQGAGRGAVGRWDGGRRGSAAAVRLPPATAATADRPALRPHQHAPGACLRDVVEVEGAQAVGGDQAEGQAQQRGGHGEVQEVEQHDAGQPEREVLRAVQPELLDGAQDDDGGGVVEHALPEHHAVQQREAVLRDDLQRRHRVGGRQDRPQRQAVLRAAAGEKKGSYRRRRGSSRTGQLAHPSSRRLTPNVRWECSSR